MAVQRWFVDTDRNPVDWSTAVVGGVAQLRIFELTVTDASPNEQMFLWANKGARIALAKVLAARAAQSLLPVPSQYRPEGVNSAEDFVLSGIVRRIAHLSQAQYDALPRKEPQTLYLIVADSAALTPTL